MATNFNFKSSYFFKIIVQVALLAMLLYQSHLALRDSDKFTFQNRVREGFTFLEKNHPGYKLYIFNEFGVDRRNCTADQVTNMGDYFAPVSVIAHGQWGVFSACIVLLNSRLGAIFAAWHALLLIFLHNMYDVRWLIQKWIEWSYKDGTPEYRWPIKTSPCMLEKEFLEKDLHIDKSGAFGAEFWKKQTDWKCGLSYGISELLLCLAFFIVITLHKRDDLEGFKRTFEKSIS